MSNDETQKERLDRIASWFLGPRAENVEYLQRFFQAALDVQVKSRNSYFPNDPIAITKPIQDSPNFKEGISRLEFNAQRFSEGFDKSHVPFWNPRYVGHMLMDTTMPSMIGYLISMIYNPNNVALEASPFTTAIEQKVGVQHCKMIGLNTVPQADAPVGWGHITCDGTVANLESVWAARNLKFYPLSLVLAMEIGPLSFISGSFKLPTCKGEQKYLRDFTPWELLNITPDVVLDIPDRLYKQYSISPQFLTATMNKFIVQSVPKDDEVFTKRFGSQNISRMAYVVSSTKHYSWPKSTALTGIGSKNVIDVAVDDDVRMDMTDLRARLDECLREERAIYAVVAIIGSTEHGACDPLKDIVEIREEYRAKGLSFVLHADGAWGSYYHTILNDPAAHLPDDPLSFLSAAKEDHVLPGFPYTALKPKTRESLSYMRHCDSITVDPHKSGYVQYPAGGLLYRDGRMRYLVTWTSPVVFREGDAENMGVYGLEGSKPGAAPSAVFMSHNVIGLHSKGYGSLLAEGIYSCVKMYARLITMSTEDTDFRVRTLIRPPVEIFGKEDNPDLQIVRDLLQKRFYEDEKDAKFPNNHRRLVEIMGSDISINTFVVNFRVNGKINEDIVEANDLNRRIFDRTSIVRMGQDINSVPLILTSTVLSQAAYKTCLTNFKRRLRLVGNQDLYVLINSVSSPFPMMYNYTDMIMKDLLKIIEEEVEVSQYRNTEVPDIHGCVMQGTDKLYLTHIPMFNMAAHRYQLIITGDLPAEVMKKYVDARKANPKQNYLLANANNALLKDMLSAGEFEAVIEEGLPAPGKPHFAEGFKLTNVRIVKMARLDSKYLHEYAAKSMPFYIYGTGTDSGAQLHIDHALLAAPNTMLSADRVTFKELKPIAGDKLDIQWDRSKKSSEVPIEGSPSIGEPYIMHFVDYPEAAMQPFPSNEIISKLDFFFRAQVDYDIIISEDIEGKKPIAKGVVQLSDCLFIDTDMLNENPVIHKHVADGPIEMHSAYHHYSKRHTNDDQRTPILQNPTVSPADEWRKFVGEIEKGSEKLPGVQ